MPNLSLHNSPVPVSRCPHCGLALDTRSWQDNGHTPEVGDLTICHGCAHVLRFGSDLRLTPMTERDERALLAANPDIHARVRHVASQLLASLDLSLRELS